MNELTNCHDCNAKPGEVHDNNCDIHYCSVCGEQFFVCRHKGNDPTFNRWTGIWPGKAEADFLGIDLNELHRKYTDLFFVKPEGKPNE